MASTVRFDADQAWLEFELSRYEFPRLTDGSDANWIVGSIKAFHPGIGPRSNNWTIIKAGHSLAPKRTFPSLASLPLSGNWKARCASFRFEVSPSPS